MKYAVGIDEVGRGPLAGPVTVCAVQWLSDRDPFTVLAGIRDSKKLSPARRLEWLERARELRDDVCFSVSSDSAGMIDEVGITGALRQASERVLLDLHTRRGIVHVYADYGLPLPGDYPSEHIVKGDEKHPLIALASVIAKVTRDGIMVETAKQFSVYGFERNKGYGTAEHRDALRKHGASPEHRRTFLGNILTV